MDKSNSEHNTSMADTILQISRDPQGNKPWKLTTFDTTNHYKPLFSKKPIKPSIDASKNGPYDPGAEPENIHWGATKKKKFMEEPKDKNC